MERYVFWEIGESRKSLLFIVQYQVKICPIPQDQNWREGQYWLCFKTHPTPPVLWIVQEPRFYSDSAAVPVPGPNITVDDLLVISLQNQAQANPAAATPFKEPLTEKALFPDWIFHSLQCPMAQLRKCWPQRALPRAFPYLNKTSVTNPHGPKSGIQRSIYIYSCLKNWTK